MSLISISLENVYIFRNRPNQGCQLSLNIRARYLGSPRNPALQNRSSNAIPTILSQSDLYLQPVSFAFH